MTMEQLKINQLKIENVKRVKAVKVEPSANGLTVIGGRNGQGKTSVLDAIAWALGGNKFKPSTAYRKGSVIPPTLHIVMSNGLVVERKGKNSDLKVLDPQGNKGGQQLLDSFVEELAINLPKFMESSNKEKAQTLLQIIGVGEQLALLEQEEKEAYSKRHTIGVIADQKMKFAKEQPYYPDAPKDLVSASDLIKQQQEILSRNGENQRKRENLAQIVMKKDAVAGHIQVLEEDLKRITQAIAEKKSELEILVEDEQIAQKTVVELVDESTVELEASIERVEEINAKVRANLNKDKAEEDAKEYADQYNALSAEINAIRKKKTELLNGAELPLEGLSVEDGELIYNGYKWDGMSGSEQLKVATAIVRKLKPTCGFVLLDKLEQMDTETLHEFGAWLEQEGLQAIATRVSTGEECSIIIEDGYVKGEEGQEEPKVEAPTWKF